MRSKWTDERLEERFDHIDYRFDHMERRFDRLEHRLDWLIGMFVAGAITVIAKGVFGA